MLDDRQIALKALSLLSTARAGEYESWVQVGMALHAAGCSVDDWANWHSDGKSNHLSTCRQKWGTFSASGDGRKVTTGLLVKWAREDSGQDPVAEFKAENEVVFDLNGSFDIEEPGGWKPGHDLLTFVKALYRKGDKIGFNTNYFLKDGEKWTPKDEGVCGMDFDTFVAKIQTTGPIAAIGGEYTLDAGMWCKINPLDGEGMKTPNVVEFRHVCVESDTIPKDQQQAIIEELRIPCVAMVDTGGRSIHAIVKIDAGKNRDLYDKRVKKLFGILKQRGFEVDKNSASPIHGSRFPGFMRGDRRQHLIAINIGCSSWGEWEDFITKRDTNALSIRKLMAVDFVADDDSLIGKRFVCRGAPWLIVSRSGIGKSSLLIQMAINFSLGREFFGLPPKKPLRSLIIQAENADLDIAEPVQGVIRGMGLTSEEIETVNSNVLFVSEDTKFGEEFCAWLDKTLTAYAPLDLVWIDPLLAYVGADTSKQGDMSLFLRNWLNPVIHKHNIGMPIIHHTPKVKKQAQADDYDLEYIGAGSSELTNWPRAVTVLEKVSSNPVIVNFKHPKRGNRLERGEVIIQHSTDGNMRWVECDQTDEKLEKIASKMPPLHDYSVELDGCLRWIIDNCHIDLERAKKLRNKWRMSSTRKSALSVWVRSEDGVEKSGRPKYLYTGKCYQVEEETGSVLDILSQNLEEELP